MANTKVRQWLRARSRYSRRESVWRTDPLIATSRLRDSVRYNKAASFFAIPALLKIPFCYFDPAREYPDVEVHHQQNPPAFHPAPPHLPRQLPVLNQPNHLRQFFRPAQKYESSRQLGRFSRGPLPGTGGCKKAAAKGSQANRIAKTAPKTSGISVLREVRAPSASSISILVTIFIVCVKCHVVCVKCHLKAKAQARVLLGNGPSRNWTKRLNHVDPTRNVPPWLFFGL